ncbi:hypothetical protein PPL_07341 [Heterostelium album PN500]|uniref:Fibronectin type-III domain-containing protein n=1 Tax=Heterostelium pallidum (strain ATCC 26659 / Pp 5 / PN500) TaxID=670386 RepID=D3BF24_HETP5|nr:hypothetical protein PPL_07341 [Heterostelium album PN500]EFA80505.1 hypothetical protein PPL_07341 [Heterostelium album PN500]|eukprot:XP_020432625.1 hypothetical protein PPL_07341 [Heterostelium album PN500]
MTIKKIIIYLLMLILVKQCEGQARLTDVTVDKVNTNSVQMSYGCFDAVNPRYSFTYPNGTPVTVDPSCITSTTCLIVGLVPATQYSIDVCCYDDGSYCQFGILRIPFVTYAEISLPQITFNSILKNGVNMSIFTPGGIPDPPTTYKIYANGTALSVLNSYSSFVVNTLQPSTGYFIEVQALNDNDQRKSSFYAVTYGNPEVAISLLNSTLNSMAVSYLSTGAIVGMLTNYTVKYNNIGVPGCINIYNTQCIISNLSYKTNYSINVISYNQINFASGVQTFSTQAYPAISNLTLSLVNKTTTTITVQYDSLNGFPGQTLYFVDVHGVLKCPSSKDKICFARNLQPGFLYNFLVNASNDGNSISVNDNFSTFYQISGLYFASNQSTTSKILIVYNSFSGIPGESYYTTKVNGTPYPVCLNVKTISCEIMNLQSATKYKIEVFATNDGTTISISKDIYTLNGVIISDINATVITTKTMSLSFGSYFGVIGLSKFTVTINNTVIPSCSQISTITCDLANLTPGTAYEIKVSVLNDGTSNEMTKIFNTYSIVSIPIITVHQQLNQTLLIKYSTSGGVPGNSLYTTSINGSDISGCVKNSSLQCLFNPYQLGYIYSITVLVENDGYSHKSFFDLKIYDYPTAVNIINIVPTSRNISIEWTESQEGVPNKSIYQASLSNGDGVNFHVFCNNITNILKCSFPNLIQNTTYSLRVSVLNTNFDAVNTTIKVKTLNDGNEYCSKSGSMECNGNGICSNGNCNCLTGWIGQYCEIPNNLDNNNPPIILPNPISPGVIIEEKGITYSFSISEIKEIDSTLSTIKRLNISSLQWNLTKSNDRNISTSINLMVTERSWHYSVSIENQYFQSINISFYQYLSLPGVTQNDYYEYQYAGKTYSIKLGSFKYTLNISEWDFQSRLNTLEVSSMITTPIGGSCNPQMNISLINSGDINLFDIGDGNGNSVFGRLINIVLLDDIPRSISHRTIENIANQSVSIVSMIPYFESTLFVDPDFSNLITVNGKVSCPSSKDNKWKIIVGVVVGGTVGIALIAGSSYYFYKKKIMQKENKKLQNKLNNMK